MLKATATLLSALLLLLGAAFGDEVRISTANDLIEFSTKVNNGTDYSGTTIILGSDIDFTGDLSKQFEPIGNNYYNRKAHFTGIFDGQGYTISNLAVNNSLPYAGLFGYGSGEVIIRNVIIDSSCSFTSDFAKSLYIAGIIGEYYGSTGGLFIENCINMASLLFTEENNNYLHMGGIAGKASIDSCDSHIVNCVNYGAITHSGTVTDTYTHIGGIVAEFMGDFEHKASVLNCANYGPITITGTSKTLHLGGVVGYTFNFNANNTLSAGPITTSESTTTTLNAGAIIGNAFFTVNTVSCYWTSDLSSLDATGAGSPTTTKTSLVASNDDTLSDLNANAETNSWSKWFLITNGATASFKANDNGKAVSFKSAFAIVPGFVSPWRTSSGWASGENPFSATTVSADTTFTTTWTLKDFELTVNYGNSTETNGRYTYGTVITLPVFQDTDKVFFGGWDKIVDRMPAEDTTIHGRWMNVSEYVQVTFGTKDLTKDEIEEIINLYTTDPYTILEYQASGSNAYVTIQFVGATESANFVKAVLSSKYSEHSITDINTLVVERPAEPSYSSSSSSSIVVGGSSHPESSSSTPRASLSENPKQSSSLDDSDSKSFSGSIRPLFALFFLLR